MRLAVRDLRRYRLFAVTALSALAVGMALNVTVYTGMDAMLFRGLPLAQRSDRLVSLAMRSPQICRVAAALPKLAVQFELSARGR